MSYNDLKQRVAALRQQAANHAARVEQAQRLVAEREQQVHASFGVEPSQLADELAKAEAEVQSLGAQILGILQAAGA